MQLMLVRHLWGLEACRWEDEFPNFKAFGYEAIETPVPEPAARERFKQALDGNGLKYLPMVFTEGEGIEESIDSLKAGIEAAQPFKPVLITCHSGRDFWDDQTAASFYELALKVEEAVGIPIAHETHRFRCFYNPWTTQRMMDRFDTLKLCCDFSHWVCVCERLLEDLEPILRQAAEHCIHIHARVGYTEGPQVPDPRAPEYQAECAAHEQWWRWIWEAQARRGMQVSPLTPEFGPPTYLHTLPYTQMPLADLRAVCDWQAKRQAENFQRCMVR